MNYLKTNHAKFYPFWDFIKAKFIEIQHIIMHSKKTTYLTLCLSLLLSSCACDRSSSDPINDMSDKQTELYILPGLGHGLVQSPINIYSFKEHESNHHKITFHFQDQIKAIENLGHTVQLDFAAGSTIDYEQLTYTFKQMHFHTPSEHLIDGMTFPMEMHIVTNIPARNEHDVPHYLVIGVLFKMGQRNKFLDEFLQLIPKKEHSITSLKVGTVKLHDLFSKHEEENVENFYHYRGSLTTPPYTEAVEWFMLKHIIEASPEQIESISAIEGNNARHIQGVFGRSID